jgi:hypothetical protein
MIKKITFAASFCLKYFITSETEFIRPPLGSGNPVFFNLKAAAQYLIVPRMVFPFLDASSFVDLQCAFHRQFVRLNNFQQCVSNLNFFRFLFSFSEVLLTRSKSLWKARGPYAN